MALPVPRPYGRRQVTLANLAASLPEATGEFVRWLIADSGWTLPNADGTRRPITAGDVCLLFRRFINFQDDVTEPYVEALESRGVPHLLVGGKAFHEREEVDALRTALTAIEWPGDALSVFATLRGPFFAIGEEELLAYHALGHGFRPYDVPDDLPASLAPVVDALGVLRELNRLRNHRPVADTIGQLMEATRAHAGFVLWRGGEQVLANVLQIAEMARQYEADGGLSFRGFVDELREAADRAPTPEAPIVEEGTDGVRLMTVHKAKGLEFPVVILADIGCKISRDDASRYLDSTRGLSAIKLGGWTPIDLAEHNAIEASRDRAEGVRLAYVAATRARDLLVVPNVGDGPYDKSWVDPLAACLYPPLASRQSPSGRGGRAGVPRQRHGARAARHGDRNRRHRQARRLRDARSGDRRALHGGVVGSARHRRARRGAARPAPRTPDHEGREARGRGRGSRALRRVAAVAGRHAGARQPAVDGGADGHRVGRGLRRLRPRREWTLVR